MVALITVVGSLNIDLIIRTPRIPEPGETVIGSGFHTAPGGKGANQAVAAALLGSEVAMVGRVGDDDFAKTLLASLDQTHVDHMYVTRDSKHSTGVAFIAVDDAGENSIVVASGANMHVAQEDLNNAQDLIASSDVLVLQLEIPLEIVERAAQIAKANDVRVVLNPAPAQKLPRTLLESVDYLIPNESESAFLSIMPVGNISEVRAAAQALLDSGVGTVVSTLGQRGALLANEAGFELMPAYEVNVVDTTAAGDAFVGGFSVAIGEGKSVPEAVRWGNAAGALATTRLGAQTSLPKRAEVLDLFESGKPRSA